MLCALFSYTPWEFFLYCYSFLLLSFMHFKIKHLQASLEGEILALSLDGNFIFLLLLTFLSSLPFVLEAPHGLGF